MFQIIYIFGHHSGRETCSACKVISMIDVNKDEPFKEELNELFCGNSIIISDYCGQISTRHNVSNVTRSHAIMSTL